MGEKDIRLKGYFSDKERYADLWNGSLFQGREVVKPQELGKEHCALVCKRTIDFSY